MLKKIKIAFCTDFSDNANLALESLLFNSWMFNIDIDVLHLVENEAEGTASKLNEVKERIQLSALNVSNINTFLFKKGEKDKLFAQLNSGNYLSTILGLEGLGRTAGMGSFIRSVYDNVNCNLSILPLAHEIRTEYKLVVALEIKNLRFLYVLLRAHSYFNFNYTKITIVLRDEENISQENILETESFLKDIFPNIRKEIILHKNQESIGNLIENFEEKGFDYCIVFKGDFFDDYVIEILRNRPKDYEYSIKFVRSIPLEIDIAALLKGDKVDNTLEWRDM